MEAFKKQVAVLRDEKGIPLFVLDIQTITNEKEYRNLKERAENNLNIKKSDTNQVIYEKEKKIKEQINALANAIAVYIKEK